MKTNSILYKYLLKSGIKADLGIPEQLPEQTTTQFNSMVADLKANAKFKNKLIIVIYILLSILFFFCLIIFFTVRNDPNRVAYLFGGSIFSILAVIFPMINIWKDKERTDAFLSILPSLPEQDRIKAVLKYLKSDETKNIKEKQK